MKLLNACIVALIVALALSGCSSKGTTKTDASQAAGTGAAKGRVGAGGGEGGPEVGRYGTAGAGAGGGAESYGSGAYGEGAGGVGDPNDPSSPLSRRVIYFQYDSYEVLPEYVSVVNAHANYLLSNAGRSITLEGHADERGSPEYNIALGEQRARAVARMLTVQGVSEEQIQIVSFGEEKPASYGHDEGSWQQNRRVEVTYAGH